MESVDVDNYICASALSRVHVYISCHLTNTKRKHTYPSMRMIFNKNLLLIYMDYYNTI